MFAVSCIKCETIFRIQLHGPIVEVKRWIYGFFFSSLVFLLLAARTSFCLFLVRNTRVLFQMRHKCDVSMEACELCMFYLSPMLFFFFFLSSLFPRHNNTWMRFTNIGIAVFDNAEIMWQDFYFIFFLCRGKKSLLFTLDNFYTTIWLKMVCMVSDKKRTSQKTPTETLWPNIFIEVDSDNSTRLTRSFFFSVRLFASFTNVKYLTNMK